MYRYVHVIYYRYLSLQLSPPQCARYLIFLSNDKDDPKDASSFNYESFQLFTPRSS